MVEKPLFSFWKYVTLDCFSHFFVVGKICSGILLIVAVYIVSGVGSMSFKVSGQWEICA
jgi:hypothetical protein